MVQLIIFDLRDFDIKLFCYKTKHVTMVHSLYEAPIAQIIFQLKSTSRILATVLHARSGLQTTSKWKIQKYIALKNPKGNKMNNST